MDLGEKLRQARLRSGLSQRQLCGEEITRNMLSQIENGSANPSISTLQYFAGRLGLPVSYFLDEEAAVSSNQACMDAAWTAFEQKQYAPALDLLKDYRLEDPVYDREFHLLKLLLHLNLAEQASADGKRIFAAELLNRASEEEAFVPWLPELRTRRLCMLAQMGAELTEEELPDVDDVLCAQALASMRAGKPARAATLLDAARNRETANWFLLRGRAAMKQEEYGTAAKYLQQAETEYPEEAIGLLEICFRELGDFKTAYYYACKSREK